MKTFREYMIETGKITQTELDMLNENINHEITPEEEKKIEESLNAFIEEYINENRGIVDLNQELTNEGLLGSIIGGLAGVALGSSIGKIIASVLGIEKGILYDLLTSKLVGAALGSAIGKRVI